MAGFKVSQTVELNSTGPIPVRRFLGKTGDALAHTWEIQITRNNAPEIMTGYSAAVVLLRNDGDVPCVATVAGNTVTATFPAGFYAMAGSFKLVAWRVKAATGENTPIAEAWLDVGQGGSGVVIDVGTTYTLAELTANEAARISAETARAAFYAGFNSQLIANINQMNSVQAQVDVLTVHGDSSVEAAQARVDAVGTTFGTLKARLDNADARVTDIAFNVKNSRCDDGQFVKGDGSHDDTTGIQRALTNYSKIYFPKGNYLISSTLVCPPKRTILMSGVYQHESSAADVTRLFTNNNINVLSLDSETEVIGGYIDARTPTYSKSAIFIDFSNKVIRNIAINTCIQGNLGKGNGVEIYSSNTSSDSGNCYPVDLKGSIYGFNTGIYAHIGTDGDAWCSNVDVNMTIFSNTAINLLNCGAGSRLRGNYQPVVTTGSDIHSVSSPFIKLGASDIVVDAMIWDTSTMKNNIAIENRGQRNVLVGNADVATNLISDLSLIPSNLLILSSRKDSICNAPPAYYSCTIENMNGHQDNLLLGAHKKHTVAYTLTNASWDTNSTLQDYGMFVDSDVNSQFSLIDTNNPGNIVVEITLDKARPVKACGVRFCERPTNVKIELYSLKINNWVTVVNENYDTKFENTSGIDWYSYWNYSYSPDRVNFGYLFDRYVSKIRYTIALSPTSIFDGSTTSCTISNVFACDGTLSNIPNYGGALYGDLDLCRNKILNVVVDNNTTANRPLTPVSGQMFYDTTLGKPIWFNGTNWKDAAGTTV